MAEDNFIADPLPMVREARSNTKSAGPNTVPGWLVQKPLPGSRDMGQVHA